MGHEDGPTITPTDIIVSAPYAALGVCFSVYFIYLQVNFIHAFCIYCLISAVTTLLLLILAVWRAANVPSAELIAAEFRRQSVSGTVTLT